MALLRHSGIYFLARILAGGAGIARIADISGVRLGVKGRQWAEVLRHTEPRDPQAALAQG